MKAVATIFLFIQTLLVLKLCSGDYLSVAAYFNHNGIAGNITFSQNDSMSAVIITVNLDGLEPEVPYTWDVHQYPFEMGQEDRCSFFVVGSCYDPQHLGQQANYAALCMANASMCKVGDLTGRHGPLSTARTVSVIEDGYLNLYGVHTIAGRPLILNWKGIAFACANIGYPSSTAPQSILYTPFRVTFVGTVYFRPYIQDTMAVFADLYDVATDSEGRTWQAYELGVNSSSCSMAAEMPPGNGTTALCDPGAMELCKEDGQLVGRDSELEIHNSILRVFYMDTMPHLFKINHSFIVLGVNETSYVTGCANIKPLTSLQAVAQFNMNGIMGTIHFSQGTPFESVLISVDLIGLSQVPSEVRIHELNVAVQDGRPDCSSAGKPWTTVSIGINGEQLQSSGFTYNDGNLNGSITINHTYSDSDVCLFGVNSIIGRSILMYFANNSVQACANIEYNMATWQSIVHFNSSEINGFVAFIQSASDPYAATTIIVDIKRYSDNDSSVVLLPPSPPVFPSPLHSDDPTYQVTSLPSDLTQQPYTQLAPSTSDLRTSISQSPLETGPAVIVKRREGLGSTSKRLQKRTSDVETSYRWSIKALSDGSDQDIFSPYGPSLALCSPLNQLMCAIGDLEGKHGILMINKAVFTDTNLPLVGPYSVMGSSLCIQIEPNAPSVCTMISPPSLVPAPKPSDDASTSVPPTITTTSSLHSSEMAPTSLPSNMMLISSLPPSVILISSLPSSAMLTSSLPPSVIPTSSLPSNMMLISPLPSSVMLTPVPTFDVIVASSASTAYMSISTTSPAAHELSTIKVKHLIAGCVGGGLAGSIIIIFVIALLCYCRGCRRTRFVIKQPSIADTELRMDTNKTEPAIGVPCYKALHNYKPLNQDDLQLTKGDIVTLVQASSSSEWWLGTVEDKTGWFPKICVKYFDKKAEERERQKVGTITPKSEWRSRVNYSFRKACGIKETTIFEQSLKDAARSKWNKIQLDGCPGSPDSTSEVIVNMVAIGNPDQVVMMTSSEHKADCEPGLLPGDGHQ